MAGELSAVPGADALIDRLPADELVRLFEPYCGALDKLWKALGEE